jgi:hypothetical protein
MQHGVTRQNALIDTLHATEKTDGPVGLGGWLILVGLGVVISPFRMIYEGVTLYGPLLRDNVLQALADPTSPAYTAYLAEFIYAEIGFNVIFVVWAITNLVLFFAKNRRFPASFRYFLIANLVFLISDALVISSLFPDEIAFDAETTKAIFQLAISTAIWVPYTLLSKRVKNTFVN